VTTHDRGEVSTAARAGPQTARVSTGERAGNALVPNLPQPLAWKRATNLHGEHQLLDRWHWRTSAVPPSVHWPFARRQRVSHVVSLVPNQAHNAAAGRLWLPQTDHQRKKATAST
jgi:hypothetical protein